jgi:hypothetical protein
MHIKSHSLSDMPANIDEIRNLTDVDLEKILLAHPTLLQCRVCITPEFLQGLDRLGVIKANQS